MESIWIKGKLFSRIHVRHLGHHKHPSMSSSICDTKCYRWGFGAHKHRGTCCKRGRTNWKHNPNADICKQAVNHGILMVGQQKQLISELHFDEFRSRSSFLYCQIRFKKPGDYLFWFSLGGNVMDQRSGECRFSGRIKMGTRTVKCWTRRLPLLEQDHPKLQL